jgi:ferredoxin
VEVEVMNEILTREQLQDATRCSEYPENGDFVGCDTCKVAGENCDNFWGVDRCVESCAKTALHYMDKCERQAAVLRQAREAMEQIVNKYQPIGGKIHAAIAAIAAIDGEGKENG